jgi:electron transfer flavoprotein beta subunit
MGMPFIGYVSSVLEVNENNIKVKRLMEDRYEIFEVNFPAAISVLKDINVPRVPSLRGKMKAKNADIPTWGLEELGADKKDVGLSGSYTQVVKVSNPRIKRETVMIEGTPEEKAEKLNKILKELNIL